MPQHSCFNPPHYRLGNLRFFSDVLVIAIGNNGCIDAGWAMGQPPNRRRQKSEVFFVADVAFRAEESQYRARRSRNSTSGVCVQKVFVRARRIGNVQLSRSTDKRRRRAVGQPSKSSPAPSSTSFFAWANSWGSSRRGEYPTRGEATIDTFTTNPIAGITVALFDQNTFTPGRYGVGILQQPPQDGAGIIGDFAGATPDFKGAVSTATVFTGYYGVGYGSGVCLQGAAPPALSMR